MPKHTSANAYIVTNKNMGGIEWYVVEELVMLGEALPISISINVDRIPVAAFRDQMEARDYAAWRRGDRRYPVK